MVRADHVVAMDFHVDRVTGMPLEGFARAGLRLNLVLRWEYRLGSTLFLVFNHAGENPPGRQPSSAFGPVGLGQGRAFDTFLVKWSYLWHL